MTARLLTGHFNLRDDVVFSVPVTFGEGKWSVVSDVTVGDELRKRLELCEDELYRVQTHLSCIPFRVTGSTHCWLKAGFNLNRLPVISDNYYKV